MVNGSDDIDLLILVSSHRELILKRLAFLRMESELINKFCESCMALRTSKRQERCLLHCSTSTNFESDD